MYAAHTSVPVPKFSTTSLIRKHISRTSQRGLSSSSLSHRVPNAGMLLLVVWVWNSFWLFFSCDSSAVLCLPPPRLPFPPPPFPVLVTHLPPRRNNFKASDARLEMCPVKKKATPRTIDTNPARRVVPCRHRTPLNCTCAPKPNNIHCRWAHEIIPQAATPPPQPTAAFSHCGSQCAEQSTPRWTIM